MRDRIVVCVLAAALPLGLLAWKELSPWAALGVLLVALVVAAAVYRTEKSAPPGPREDERRTIGSDADGR